MARANSKLLGTLYGYELSARRTKGEIGVSHMFSGNFTLNFETVEALVQVLSIPEFRANFLDKRAHYVLTDTLVQFGRRPNNSLLAVVKDLQVFKANELNHIFVQSKVGVNYTFYIPMLEELYMLYTNNYEFRQAVGLEG